MRYLTPILLTGLALWMWRYNGSEADSKLVFPFIELLIPGVAGDPTRMAGISLQLAGCAAAMAWALAIAGHARDRRARCAQGVPDVGDDAP